MTHDDNTVFHRDMIRVGHRIYVAGRNPELCDVDNREGNIYRDSYYLEIEANDGEVFVHEHTFDTRDEAEAFGEHVASALQHGASVDPTRWRYTRDAYGSPAYVRNEAEHCEEERRLDEEADLRARGL